MKVSRFQNTTACICLGFCAVAAFSPASATTLSERLRSFEAPPAPAAPAHIAPRTSAMNYEEDFESFPTGGIDGVSGWIATSSAIIKTAGLQSGGSPPSSFGDNSLIVNWASGSNGGSAQSPNFADPAVFGDPGAGNPGAFGLIEADVMVYSSPGQAADVVPAISTVKLGTNLINTRVVLQPDGTIEALQVSGGSGVFLPTTGFWSEDQPTRIGIEVLPENILNVYQDGVLIFSGHDIAVELGAGSGGIHRIWFQTFNENFNGPYPCYDNIEMIQAPLTGLTERVSVSSADVQGNGHSNRPATSADGRFIAFQSGASNLVPDDTNNVTDIFVHDRMSGETERVSVSSLGVQSNGLSESPAMSADGRFIAFQSSAINLVPDDTNSGSDIFVHDHQTGTTTRVSVNSAGEQAMRIGGVFCAEPSISADGRFVAFVSDATNLASDDTNSAVDIFVHDRDANETGIFDEPGGIETTRVSVASDGSQSNLSSWSPAISADGRHVAFRSGADNLVPNDTNIRDDIFVHDRLTDATTRVNISSNGEQSDQNSDLPAISADGRFVAFISVATNLVPDDTISPADTFVHDRDANETGVFDEPGGIATIRVSVNSDGMESNSPTLNLFGQVSISADGRRVAFSSRAPNLVPGDTNGGADVFLHDRDANESGVFDEPGGIETTRVSVSSSGGQAVASLAPFSLHPAISADGALVAFESNSTSLVTNDSNNRYDIFVRTGDAPSKCPADLDGDGLVGSADLGALLGCWGMASGACAGADLTDDGLVGSADLGEMLGVWGPCP